MAPKTRLFSVFVISVLLLIGLRFWAVQAAPLNIIYVETSVDELIANKNCSLREAINNANADAQPHTECEAGSGRDVIDLPDAMFIVNLGGSGGAGEDGNATGDLDILDDLVIDGSGKDTYIQGGSQSPINGSCVDCYDRVLDIAVDIDVEINDLTIQYGHTPDGITDVNSGNGEPGGGIRNQGTLVLNQVRVYDNLTGNGAQNTSGTSGYGGHGGGIYVDGGTLEMINSHVRYNLTGNGGIGSMGETGGMGGWGGGIRINHNDVMTITNSTIWGNTTGDGGLGGLGVSTLSGNGGRGGHGGGFDAQGASIWIINSEIINNTTGNGGNGGNHTSSSDGGNGGRGGEGGGFYITVASTTVYLEDSSISLNSTGDGGDGGSSVSGSPGNNSIKGYGGGFYSHQGTLSLNSCAINNNSASYGGGIYAYNDSDVDIYNCTISGNNSTLSGGGITSSSAATFQLTFTTVTNNTADSDDNGSGGGGGFSIISSTTFTATNSIIAGNIDMGGQDPDCDGTLISNNYNLIGDPEPSACSFTPQGNDIYGTHSSPEDPLLYGLADNGGPTQTHALMNISPARDYIPSGSNGCLIGTTLDQRGVLRIEACDIGAYDFDDFILIYLPLMLR